MFDLAAAGACFSSAYPERQPPRPGAMDKIAMALSGRMQRKLRGWRTTRGGFLDSVTEQSRLLEGAADDVLASCAQGLREALRRDGLREDLVARSFALVRELSGRTLGQRHYPCQMVGAWVMLNGLVAEMETGEGKTLTATLAACTAALAGMPVHVITVNDYLAERDAQIMGPLYHALGVSVGTIIHGLSPAQRREAYGCDVAYCSNKEIAFDYLRDRIVLARRDNRTHLAVDRLAGDERRSAQLVMRGLFFAIVDEADSVLVDEARTPLIIAGSVPQGPEREMYQQALELADKLEAPKHYRLHLTQRAVDLSEEGRDRLEELAGDLTGPLRGPRRREELVSQALSALHLFERDVHYLVKDGKIQIVDESTGRTLADRSWELGLHQMVEVKEACDLSNQQTSIARITYQRFFKRYLWLAGMTGTAQEVAGELWSVYGLAVRRIPTNRPVQRRYLPDQVYSTAAEKWRAVVERIAHVNAQGRPILVGTRSVAASEHLSELLEHAGLQHRLLNARQDKDEAEIVAVGGEKGAITVATNMAGRGTDIKLGEGVRERGGLHVIATELHEAARVDRQLFGRCGRQGDPGSVEAYLSLEDELLKLHLVDLSGVGGWLKKLRLSRRGGNSSRMLFSLAQMQAERYNAAIRREVQRQDEQMGDMLAFSGRGE